MRKRIIIIAAFLLFILPDLFSQISKSEEHKDLVEWMTLTEALEKQKTQPKKIFIDIYTDWCSWCKVMSKNTFSHQQIAGYINQYFYPVRFDAETTDTIEYLGKQYVNKGVGRRPTHELAFVLTNNRPSYPTITYLDEKGAMIQPLPGYMDVKKIEPYLVYFNENAYRSAPFDAFKLNFDKAFNDTIEKNKGKVQWVTFADAQKMIKTSPKPLLIDINASFSVTSKVMELTTFTDEKIADYINDNFYAVNFNPTTKDTIEFGGMVYYNKGVGHPFHDLALLLTNRQIGIPATVYLNENLQLLSNVPGYRSPDELESLLVFFGEAKYKTQQWDAFIKEFVENKNKANEKK